MIHKIYTEYDDDTDRAHWSCSCGAGGSASCDRVDLASDKHIVEGEHRIDTNKPW
jgi:hypothetical protein